jgi:hypothetical protein
MQSHALSNCRPYGSVNTPERGLCRVIFRIESVPDVSGVGRQGKNYALINSRVKCCCDRSTDHKIEAGSEKSRPLPSERRPRPKLAQKINLGRASSHYEMTDSRHHRDYLVCTDCGEVTPLECPCPVDPFQFFATTSTGPWSSQ